MENSIRAKIKIGPHEFEMEGPADIVQDELRAFRALIPPIPPEALAQPQIEQKRDENPATIASARVNAFATDVLLGKIMNVDGRVVSLTVRPGSADDAVLLILYGQKALRENDSITGGEVIEGLTATGGLAVTRVDRLLEKAGRDGDVIVLGERRGKRYRLTNQGINKARQIAADLIAIVP
jgi:hypothetical protein